jgi:hypothetical protein
MANSNPPINMIPLSHEVMREIEDDGLFVNPNARLGFQLRKKGATSGFTYTVTLIESKDTAIQEAIHAVDPPDVQDDEFEIAEFRANSIADGKSQLLIVERKIGAKGSREYVVNVSIVF